MAFRSFVALAAAIASTGSCSTSPSSPDPPRPSRAPPADVRFEPRSRDVEGLSGWGVDGPVGENVAVSFDLVNASDHPVRLVDAACKWGHLRVDTPSGASIPARRRSGGLPRPLTIAAGERVTLVDGFDGRLACEPGMREECWVRAWIDGATEPLEATIRWRRRPVDAVHGDSPDLGEIAPRGTIERRFVLESEDLGEFEVGEVAVFLDPHADPHFAAAFDVRKDDGTPPGAARSRCEIVARIDSSKLPYGSSWASIYVPLRRARIPGLRIGMRWKLEPPFELLMNGAPVGDSFQLGVVKQLEVPARRVVFHSRDPANPVHVRSARIEAARDGTRFAVAVGPFVDGDTPLDLALSEVPKQRALRGELVIETDDPRAPEWRKRIVGLWNVAPAPPAGK